MKPADGGSDAAASEALECLATAAAPGGLRSDKLLLILSSYTRVSGEVFFTRLIKYFKFLNYFIIKIFFGAFCNVHENLKILVATIW